MDVPLYIYMYLYIYMIYRKISNISRTKTHNLNVPHRHAVVLVHYIEVIC